jgi:hypothetical protein
VISSLILDMIGFVRKGVDHVRDMEDGMAGMPGDGKGDKVSVTDWLPGRVIGVAIGRGLDTLQRGQQGTSKVTGIYWVEGARTAPRQPMGLLNRM